VTYLLDTNAVIALLKGDAALRAKLRDAMQGGETITVSSIVLFELWYGVARSTRQTENGARLRVFLSGDIGVVLFEDEDAIAAGNLRAALEALGTPIGPYDILIAAQALRTAAILVTANVSEFARVQGLVWQDWSRAG
jgi:tRNA(fMet)-specific endonuclease VapC